MKWRGGVSALSLCGIIAITAIATGCGAESEVQAAAKMPALFAHFQSGMTTTVDLPAMEVDTLDVDGDERLRDWLLYATMFGSGLDATLLQSSLYDLPAIRSEYLRPAGAFSYGPMRWRREPWSLPARSRIRSRRSTSVTAQYRALAKHLSAVI